MDTPAVTLQSEPVLLEKANELLGHMEECSGASLMRFEDYKALEEFAKDKYDTLSSYGKFTCLLWDLKLIHKTGEKDFPREFYHDLLQLFSVMRQSLAICYLKEESE